MKTNLTDGNNLIVSSVFHQLWSVCISLQSMFRQRKGQFVFGFNVSPKNVGTSSLISAIDLKVFVGTAIFFRHFTKKIFSEWSDVGN